MKKVPTPRRRAPAKKKTIVPVSKDTMDGAMSRRGLAFSIAYVLLLVATAFGLYESSVDLKVLHKQVLVECDATRAIAGWATAHQLATLVLTQDKHLKLDPALKEYFDTVTASDNRYVGMTASIMARTCPPAIHVGQTPLPADGTKTK